MLKGELLRPCPADLDEARGKLRPAVSLSDDEVASLWESFMSLNINWSVDTSEYLDSN